MSNLLKHAESELKRMGMGIDTQDPMNKLMHDQIIQIVKTFSTQGHSGFSAGYAVGIIEKLLRFEPLSPLTGEHEEWVAVQSEDNVVTYQNKRYSCVFKEGRNGRAYDIEAVAYRRGKDGTTFIKGGQRHYISFPYTPSTKIITIPKWQFWR